MTFFLILACVLFAFAIVALGSVIVMITKDAWEDRDEKPGGPLDGRGGN